MQNFGAIHGLMARINLKNHHEAQNFEQIASNHGPRSKTFLKSPDFCCFLLFFSEAGLTWQIENSMVPCDQS